MPEQLGLGVRLGDGAAIDHHERPAGPWTQFVHPTRHEFLAGSRLPDDQHRGGGWRGTLDVLHQALHERVVDDELAAERPQLLLQRRQPPPRDHTLGRLVDEVGQLAGVRLLHHVVEGAALDGLDHGAGTRHARQHDDLGRCLQRADAGQRLEAVNAVVQGDVQQHHVGAEGGDLGLRFLRVVRRGGVEEAAQYVGHGTGERPVVIDDKDAVLGGGFSSGLGHDGSLVSLA
jgi:hypothetical protein